MARASQASSVLTAEEIAEMHEHYREGGARRQMAPHIVYPQATCPHAGCGQPMQAIDFRPGAHGRSVHDPLVRAWWDDTGFAGRCPRCGGWVDFTLRERRAISGAEAARLPRLPDAWHVDAIIL